MARMNRQALFETLGKKGKPSNTACARTAGSVCFSGWKEAETATAIQNWDGWMDGWQCSYCKNAMIGNKPNYCPNCGRKFTDYQLKEEPKDEWEDTNEKDEDN